MFRSAFFTVTRPSRRSFTFVVTPATTTTRYYDHHHDSFAAQRQRWATTLVLADPSPTTMTIAPGTCQAMTAANELKNDKITLLIVGGTNTPKEIPLGTTKVVHVPFTDVVLPETVAAAVYAAVQADTDIAHIVATDRKSTRLNSSHVD